MDCREPKQNSVTLGSMLLDLHTATIFVEKKTFHAMIYTVKKKI